MLPRRARRALALVGVAWIWLLAGIPTAGAQPEAPGARPAASAPETPPPPPPEIPVTELSSRAKDIGSRLSAIEQRRTDEAVGDEVREALDAVAADIERASERLEQAVARRATSSDLEGVRGLWKEVASRLDAIDEQLTERADQLDGWLSEVDGQIDLWRRSRAAARAAQAPAGVLSLVNETLRELEGLQKRLARSRNGALELQTRAAAKRDPVDAALERVRKAKAEIDSAVFERQAPPLWQLELGIDVLRAEVTAGLEGFAAIGSDFIDDFDREVDLLILQLVLILVLVVALRRARATVGEVPDVSEVGVTPERALAHPWAVAILIGLVLTPLVRADRQLGIQLLTFLGIVPVWWLVIRAIAPLALRPPLSGLALLALTDSFRIAFPGFDLMTRGLLVVELALGLAGTLWLRRIQQLRRIPPELRSSLWFRLLDAWLRIALLSFGAGLLAELIGYSNLAERLAVVAIWGSLMGLGFLAAARMLEVIAQAAIGRRPLSHSRLLEIHRDSALRQLSRALRLGAFAAWSYLLLRAISLWDPLREALGLVLGASLGEALSLGGVVSFALVLWLAWLLSRLVSLVLDHEVFPRFAMRPGVPFALATFTRYVILVIGFVGALSLLGFSLDRVALLLSALGVGIGFGLQNVVNNFVSGAILLFERPLRVGDRVQLGDLLGVISTIGIRASRVRTFDGADVIVPNGDLLSSQVINWTLSDRKRRVIIPVGVAYGTPLREVLELLEGVARANPEVLDDPPPEALFIGFGDSYYDLQLRAFTQSERGWMPVASDLGVAINEALSEAGITIPFPQRDINMKNALRIERSSERGDG